MRDFTHAFSLIQTWSPNIYHVVDEELVRLENAESEHASLDV